MFQTPAREVQGWAPLAPPDPCLSARAGGRFKPSDLPVKPREESRAKPVWKQDAASLTAESQKSSNPYQGEDHGGEQSRTAPTASGQEQQEPLVGAEMLCRSKG